MRARFLIVDPPPAQSSTVAALATETERALAAATGTRFAKRYLGYPFSEDATTVPDVRLIALSAWSADPVSLRTAWTKTEQLARIAREAWDILVEATLYQRGRLVGRLRPEHRWRQTARPR